VTAEAIGLLCGLAVLPLAAVIDIDYGEWQGLTPEEAASRWPAALHAWYTARNTVQPPDGESLDGLRERVMGAIRELAERHCDETIAVVSHTVVNRVILLAVLGLGNERFWRLGQDNCAINVFEATAGEFTLVSLNDVCHLRSLPGAPAVVESA
jgi:broad specificity phosphatase PhoE